MPDQDFSHLCGWVDHPDRFAMAAELPHPTFAQAAPQLMGADQDIFLYRAWKDALGAYPHYPAQQIGDCTSFGSGHALDLLQCIEMVLGHQPIDYRETCTEAIYGMGRELANMLRPPGPHSDGCYGVAVSRVLTDQGAVPRELVGTYSGKRAGEWGWHRVPDEVKAAAASFKLGAATLVTTLEELDAALANLYPCIVCSNWGFTQPRDSDGFCRPSGSWGHCMGISGRRTRNGRHQYLIDQSWGDNLPGGPTTDDQPVYSFWIDQNPMASMIAQRDSLAYSAFGGFVKRPAPPEWTLAEALL